MTTTFLSAWPSSLFLCFSMQLTERLCKGALPCLCRSPSGHLPSRRAAEWKHSNPGTASTHSEFIHRRAHQSPCSICHSSLVILCSGKRSYWSRRRVFAQNIVSTWKKKYCNRFVFIVTERVIPVFIKLVAVKRILQSLQTVSLIWDVRGDFLVYPLVF